MLSLLMQGLKEEDGPRRSSLYCESPFDKKSRDVTREQAIARAKVRRVEWRNLDESTLFEVDRENELARA